jgi:hypothetical protein
LEQVATSNVQNLDSKFKKNCIFVGCLTAGQSTKGTTTGAVWPSYLCHLLVFADWLVVGKDILCRLLGMTDCSHPKGSRQIFLCRLRVQAVGKGDLYRLPLLWLAAKTRAVGKVGFPVVTIDLTACGCLLLRVQIIQSTCILPLVL